MFVLVNKEVVFTFDGLFVCSSVCAHNYSTSCRAIFDHEHKTLKLGETWPKEESTRFLDQGL